ncbi:hypothetical protein Tco_0104076 [Tanacetum coccineum]
MGEGSANPTDPYHTSTIIQPTTSQTQKKQRPRKPKRKETQIPLSSGPIDNVVDEAVNEEMDDSLERAATTATSLDAEQDKGNINKTQSKATTMKALVPKELLSGGGPRRKKTMGDYMLKPRLRNVSTTSNDLLLQEDKGKGIMIEEPVVEKVKPMKRLKQIRLDEELAFKLQAKEEEEKEEEEEEEEILAKEKAQQTEEANIAWDDFLKQRRKHFAAKRAEEKKNRPPTRVQQRSIITELVEESSKKAEVEITQEKMKVIKEGSEKLGLLKINDDSFACNTPLGTIFNEFNRLSGMDDDLFTYVVEIPRLSSIPCDEEEGDNSDDGDLDVYELRVCYDKNDGIYGEVVDVKVKEGVISKWLVRSYKKQFDEYMEIKKQWVIHGINDDMEYDPSDTTGDDEVELTNEEFSVPDNENLIDKDEVAKIFRIETRIFNFDTLICKAFYEFNYLLKIDTDLLTSDILGFKTYDEF